MQPVGNNLKINQQLPIEEDTDSDENNSAWAIVTQKAEAIREEKLEKLEISSETYAKLPFTVYLIMVEKNAENPEIWAKTPQQRIIEATIEAKKQKKKKESCQIQ